MSDPLSHVVASWLTPAASDDDSRILSLFRKWVVAERVVCALGENENFDESAEYSEAVGRAEELVAAISDIPAAGAVGLAIKSYLTIQAEDGTPRDDMAALGGEALDYCQRMTKSILEDAVCFVPELAPLAAAAIAAKSVDQVEDPDVTHDRGDAAAGTPSQADPRAADDLVWPLTAAQERFAEAVCELEKRRIRRLADAEAADPVLALIAELHRLDDLVRDAIHRGHGISEAFERQACALADQIRNTKPSTLAAAIAMLEWGHEDGCCDEHVVEAVIGGLRDLLAARE